MAASEMPLEARALTGTGPERELVASCRAGDPAAFARLVQRHEEMVYGLAARLLGDAEEARDVAQEVFLQVYRMLDRFEGRSKPQDLGVPHRGEPVPQPPALLAPPSSRPRGSPGRGTPRGAGDGRSPGEGAWAVRGGASAGAGGEGQAALLQLSFEHRSVLVLREVEGLTCEEVAAALGVPEGTVKSRLSRAREAMRVRLQGLVQGGAS